MFRVIRKWWPKIDGQPLIRVRLGYWRELRKWPVPGSVFEWSGYLPNVWYFLKCAVWRRHDRLEIPTLPPTWIEWDCKLLHAAFAVLVDFVETHGPGRWTVAALQEEIARAPTEDEYGGKEWCENYLPTAIEIEALHRWWTVERDRDQAAEEASLTAWHDRFEACGGLQSVLTDHPNLARMVFPVDAKADELHRLHREIEDRNNAKDEEMLIRLMRVRQSLWT